jgi:hypothetical protein
VTSDPDPRLLRLLDLAEHQHIVVTCQCGRIVEYMPGFLQRRHRLASTTLIYDLQFRLRCRHCRAERGFKIVVADVRNRGNRAEEPPELVIVPASPATTGRKG